MKTLMVLLDGSAPSYCHYPSTQSDTEDWISPDLLKKGLLWAQENQLQTGLIWSGGPIPGDLAQILDEHATFSIHGDPRSAEGSVLVLDVDERDLPSIQGTPGAIVIRFSQKSWSKIPQIVGKLSQITPRISLISTDLLTLKGQNLEDYSRLLESLAQQIEKEILQDRITEVDILSDRLTLTKMNNCNAGVDFVTLCPDGNLYPCPGFYQEENPEPWGTLEKGLESPLAALFRYENAPICRECDSWQCKRCTWMNRKSTREYNTPSQVQCKVSHLQRGASGRLLESLKSQGKFSHLANIIPMDDHDPLDRVLGLRPKLQERGNVKVQFSDRELLEQIYRQQEEILFLLRQKNHHGAAHE